MPEVLKAVRINLRDNAKLIKICASGGVMSEVDHPMHQQFSDEELAAIVAEEAADLMLETGAMLVPARFVIESLLGQIELLLRYAYDMGRMIDEAYREAMKVAIAKGVEIAAGCDTFVSGQMYGENSREIEHLINAGLTGLEAIEAATANGPETPGGQAPR